MMVARADLELERHKREAKIVAAKEKLRREIELPYRNTKLP